MPPSTDQRLGELALDRRLLTLEQLTEALAEQEELEARGLYTRLGQILVRLKHLTPDQLVELLKQQAQPGPSPVPAIHEKYRVVQEIGSGSGGMVYLAEDVALGRPVALKVLRADTTTSKTAVRRFFAEGKALAKLRHPGIVQVYEIGQADETYFIAMEYVPGETLDRHCLRMRLGPKQAAALVADVADAVAHAHGQGIIHRDLKPQNIMVETDGPQRRIRVMDFGLAHDTLALTRLTATGAVVGTPMYMAPEQVAGTGVDARTDVYALGAILYELLAGRPPFSGRTQYELYESIVAVDAVPLRRINPRAPRDLEVVAMCALNKVPAFRYPTAEAMANDLRRYLKGDPVVAKGLSLTRRLITRARRWRMSIAIASLLVVIAAVVGGVLVRAARQESKFERLLGQVDGFVKSGDYVEGARRLGEAAVLRPEDERMKPRREGIARLTGKAVDAAEARLKEGKAREAVDLAQRVLSANPKDARAAACLDAATRALDAQARAQGGIVARLGVARELIADCERAVTLPPSLYDEKSLKEKLGRARGALNENLELGERLDAASRAQTEILMGRLELQEGRDEEAIEAFGRAIALDPSGPAYYGRGEATLAKYRRERAYFGARDQDLPDVYRKKMREIGLAAAADFDKAVSLRYGTGWEPEYMKALVERAEGHPGRALERLDRLHLTDQAPIWLLRGEILADLGQYARAIEDLEKAVDIARSDTQARVSLANARLMNALYGVPAAEIIAELERAIQSVDAAIRIRPTVASLHSLRGRLRFYRVERLHFQQVFQVDEDLAVTLKDYDRAIQLDPRDDHAHAGRAIVLLQTGTTRLFQEGGFRRAAEIAGEFDIAAEAMQKAIDLNPWEGYLYKDKGLALAMKGLCLMLTNQDPQPTLDAAFQLIKKSEEMDPGSPQAHEAMALAYLWQATADLQKMRNMRPSLEKAIASSTRAIEEAATVQRARSLAFRSVLRMVLAFYLFFFSSKAEAADLFDAGATDMKEAAAIDPMLATYDPEPIEHFSRALRLQVEGKDAGEAFASAERRLSKMADADASRGGGAFLARVFGRSMRGFCFFYTERYKEAVEEWTALTKQFPPMAFVLAGWISQAKKKSSGQ